MSRTFTPALRTFARILALVLAGLADARAAVPAPLELPGIQNAFRLTPRILSGSQPEGEEGFAALARAGVKLIISVDGEKPRVELAGKQGLRYVHLPIGYDGISATRVIELAKAAAPDAGKIFVHCHHGRHRGPAAAGVICEAVAGWSPAQAEAWLRQAGTGGDYPGLYRAVRDFVMPAAGQIAAIGPLPETAKTPALVDAMVAMDGALDGLKEQLRRDWNAEDTPASRPSAHAALALTEQIHELARTGEMASRPEEFRRLLAETENSAAALLRLAGGDGPSTAEAVHSGLKRLMQSCAACHKAYRNEKK